MRFINLSRTVTQTNGGQYMSIKQLIDNLWNTNIVMDPKLSQRIPCEVINQVTDWVKLYFYLTLELIQFHPFAPLLRHKNPTQQIKFKNSFWGWEPGTLVLRGHPLLNVYDSYPCAVQYILDAVERYVSRERCKFTFSGENDAFGESYRITEYVENILGKTLMSYPKSFKSIELPRDYFKGFDTRPDFVGAPTMNIIFDTKEIGTTEISLLYTIVGISKDSPFLPAIMDWITTMESAIQVESYRFRTAKEYIENDLNTIECFFEDAGRKSILVPNRVERYENLRKVLQKKLDNFEMPKVE